MLVIGSKNTTSQAVLTDGTISLGSTYRKYCKPTSCGSATYVNNGNGITINRQGMYHIIATLVGSGTTAGTITVQLNENGTAVSGAFSSETITTADTELRTFVIDYYILVDSTNILGCNSTQSKTISLTNTGVGATFTSVIVNVEKVV